MMQDPGSASFIIPTVSVHAYIAVEIIYAFPRSRIKYLKKGKGEKMKKT